MAGAPGGHALRFAAGRTGLITTMPDLVRFAWALSLVLEVADGWQSGSGTPALLTPSLAIT